MNALHNSVIIISVLIAMSRRSEVKFLKFKTTTFNSRLMVTQTEIIIALLSRAFDKDFNYIYSEINSDQR